MDISTLIRDPNKARAALVRKGDLLVTPTGCKIYFPVRYAERKLAVIGSEVTVVGYFGIVIDDKYYGVSKSTAKMNLKPSSLTIRDIGDEQFFELGFDPGAIVCTNVNLVVVDTTVYYIFDEIFAKGHIPWYYNYEDLTKMFVSAKKMSGFFPASSNVVMAIIAASITRDIKNPTTYYRQIVKTDEDLRGIKPLFIPFRSVIFGANNTTSKILGSYFNENILSALVNPSKKTEGVENLLRQ